MKKIFGLEVTPEVIDAIAREGERTYPNEACGVALGDPAESEIARVVPLTNVQDKYHAKDPRQFPRTGRDAFRLDELERMKVLYDANDEGLVERILFHSHPDAAAYFSPDDRAAAIHEGIELMPGIVHVVVSVRGGARADMAAFRYDAEQATFDEVRIPLERWSLDGAKDLAEAAAGSGPAELQLPDLESRRMQGGEASRPVLPVGEGLSPRVLTAAEADAVEALIELDVVVEPAVTETIVRLGVGLLSPLTGFLRKAELDSIAATGRLLSGATWRAPISLTVARDDALAPATVVALVDAAGRRLAVMGVVECDPAGNRFRLGGPVYVLPATTAARRHVADLRAELIRRGATRVLAAPPDAEVEEEDYDVVLRSTLDAIPGALTLPFAATDFGWLEAAMAQNAGATHVWVTDRGAKHAISSTLKIVPVRAPGRT